MNTIAENTGLTNQLWLYLDTVLIDFDNIDNTTELQNAVMNVLLGSPPDE